MPRDGLALREDPEQLLALLTRLWPTGAPPLDGGWADLGVTPAIACKKLVDIASATVDIDSILAAVAWTLGQHARQERH